MRIAFTQLLRTRPKSNTRLVLQRCTYSIARPQAFHHFKHIPLIRCRSISNGIIAPKHIHGNTKTQWGSEETVDKAADAKRKRNASTSTSESRQISLTEDDALLIPHLSPKQRKDPNTWIRLIEKHIPHSLRQDSTRNLGHRDASRSEGAANDILKLLAVARKAENAGTDVLAYMILNSDRRAALWICDALLKKLASKWLSRPSERPPSNLSWPEQSLDAITSLNVRIDGVSHASFEPCEKWETITKDPRHTSAVSDLKDTTLDQIWSTLGSVVIQSVSITTDGAQKALNAVQLVLGQIHNLNLIPDNVYAYGTTSFSATVQRPPVIHLVSSRILTALSDAAWRDQQEESIEKAASHGLSYAEIGRDPPGGRFRLKVSPLDPEVWLEFILWCCVEGGFAAAGSRIIKQLQKETKSPWFAVNWSGASDSGLAAPRIDWDRVKTRTGGTVGRLEGYSKVKPLAEVPRRTISTEVVLALVESFIDVVQRVNRGNGISLGAVQNGIVGLITFLEPHDLPLSYFDYLAARLLMTDSTETSTRSNMMKRWWDRLAHLKSLKRIQQPPHPQISFQMHALSVHSEFTAGLLHQVLDSFVQDGNIKDALKAFNELQKHVDNSKLHAISAFLQRIPSSDDKFFSSRFFSGNPDFVNSHGQLPLYKLAGLLNLAIDTNLIGFGQWLLYNYDPDGPLISHRVYGNSAIAQALVRFAGVSNDLRLLQAIPSSLSTRRLPTVNLLRVTFNAYVTLLDFRAASQIMDQLKKAKAGGFGLSNLAHLAGTIFKIENGVLSEDDINKESLLRQATYLLNSMLVGHLDSRTGDLQRSIRVTFRQQVGHLLKMFEMFPDSAIASFAEVYRDHFSASNLPNLSPSIFNMFLEAVVEAKGAEAGVRLVDAFCTPMDELEDQTRVPLGDFIGDEETHLNLEDLDDVLDSSQIVSHASNPSQDTPTRQFIPFVSSAASNMAPEDAALTVQSQHARGSDAGTDADTNLDMASEPSDNHPEDEIAFESPFFQETGSEGTRVDREKASSGDVSNDLFEPVCVRSSRTIRLIVRAANRELQERESAGLGAALQYDILQWAEREFKSLGVSAHTTASEIGDLPAEATMSPRKGTRVKKAPVRTKIFRPSGITKAFGGKHTIGGALEKKR